MHASRNVADPVIPAEPKSESARLLLVLAAALVLVVWQLPYGGQILYPFTLLATYAHEMGHGLAAIAVGGRFEALMMYPDGSGLAEWRGSVGRLGRAFVAAGGLIGPSVAGTLILVASRRTSRSRAVLAVLALAMALTVVLFVRSVFGWIFVLSMAGLLGVIARWLPRIAPFVAQVLGVVLCLAVFRDLDYMFSPGAQVGGIPRLSDSGVIAEALLLPYWFWGAVVALTSFAVLGLGLFVALRPHPPAVPP